MARPLQWIREVPPRSRDLFCVAFLVLSDLLYRFPALNRVALNPDESQYEATASYLAATGRSAFALPYGTPGTMTLYRFMTSIFGAYPMTEVRLLVLAISSTMAILMFLMVRRETDRLAGVLAGLILVHYNHGFEGLSANREWFAAMMLVLGIFAYTIRADRHRHWLVVAAGAACAASFWFKLQAAYMVLAVPGAMVWEALRNRAPRRLVHELLLYGIGGIVGLAIYFIPFLAAGTLGDYFGSIVGDWQSYVTGNEAVTREAGGDLLALMSRHFFWNLPSRPLLLTAYLFSLLWGGNAIYRSLKREERLPAFDSRITIVFVLLLATAVMSIKMGHRFFDHYYIFLVPPVAALTGLAAGSLGRRDPAWGNGWRVLFVGAVLVAMLASLVATSPRLLLLRWPLSAPVLAYVVGIVAILAFLLTRPAHRLHTTLLALLCLEVALLVYRTQAAGPPRSLPSRPPGFYDAITTELSARKRPGDTLFVWGWAPEIYSLTRIEAASHMTICQFVVEDYEGVKARPTLNETMADLLLQDLRERKPRFVVDASRRSWTMLDSQDPWLYDLALYPGFELREILHERYVKRARLDECDLYERRDLP